MMSIEWSDALYILAFWGTIIPVAGWSLLTLGAVGLAKYHAQEADAMHEYNFERYPFVSVLIPAYNEEDVIEDTIRAVYALDYPIESREVIVIDDSSTDSTSKILSKLHAEFTDLKILTVPKGEGGKGKSKTLNFGLTEARGEIIAVYDADNTPEKQAIRLLVATLINNEDLAAVNGKIKTRNWQNSLLTRFINLEYIYFQWMYQGSRWYWLNVGTLMGTNYVIWHKYLIALGGFDENSLVDDTEMTFRLMQSGYNVRWVPYATSWEQEPETLAIWLKQRIRWGKGNFYVTFKYLPVALRNPSVIGLEVLFLVLNFFVFFPATILGALVFILGFFEVLNISLQGPFIGVWIMSYILYVLQMSFVIRIEHPLASNYALGAISYFTYAQLFIPVSLGALKSYLLDIIAKRDVKWVKTTRTKETSES